MAYYDALIAAWNTSSASGGALPSGVAGTSLFGLTTAQKIAAVNAWTVTGTIPTAFTVTGDQILNCINWTELAALTDAQRKDVLLMCGIPGRLLGGSANAGFVPGGMIVAYFNAASSFTGSIALFVLTVTSTPTKPLLPGATLFGGGVATGTMVVNQLTGSTGGTGTYTVSISQTVISATINVTSPTITALTALANAQVQLWWGVSVANGGGGLNGVVGQTDVTIAGLS